MLCHACGKKVYPLDFLSVDSNIYHKQCFKCGVSSPWHRLPGTIFAAPLPDADAEIMLVESDRDLPRVYPRFGRLRGFSSVGKQFGCACGVRSRTAHPPSFGLTYHVRPYLRCASVC